MERHSSGSKAAESGKCSVKARVVRPGGRGGVGVLGDTSDAVTGIDAMAVGVYEFHDPLLSAIEEAEEVPCSNSPRASLNRLSACGLGAEVPCSNSILWQVSQRVAAFPYAIE